MVLVFAMDSESHNKAANDLLEEKKNTIDPYLALSQCLPDPFHVGKETSRQFSNWHLVENGYRINPVQLTILRNDRHLERLLVEHLKVTVCRNRDRMDVDSMLFLKIIFAMIITFFFCYIQYTILTLLTLLTLLTILLTTTYNIYNDIRYLRN